MVGAASVVWELLNHLRRTGDFGKSCVRLFGEKLEEVFCDRLARGPSVAGGRPRTPLGLVGAVEVLGKLQDGRSF